MSESGGPVFEGSANFTPPKKGIVEKMKQKASEVHLSETADKVRQRVMDRLSQNTGVIVEQKWMDAYQKTVDALDPGKRKKVLENLKIVAVGAAKIARVGSAVSDVFLRWGGVLQIFQGAHAIARPGFVIEKAQEAQGGYEMAQEAGMLDYVPQWSKNRVLNKINKSANMSENQMRILGTKSAVGGFVENWMGRKRISRVAAGWLADVAGSYGEKVAQITNKILRGKPKPESMPA